MSASATQGGHSHIYWETLDCPNNTVYVDMYNSATSIQWTFKLFPIRLTSSFLRLKFGFCWPLCTFITYIYLYLLSYLLLQSTVYFVLFLAQGSRWAKSKEALKKTITAWVDRVGVQWVDFLSETRSLIAGPEFSRDCLVEPLQQHDAIRPDSEHCAHFKVHETPAQTVHPLSLSLSAARHRWNMTLLDGHIMRARVMTARDEWHSWSRVDDSCEWPP